MNLLKIGQPAFNFYGVETRIVYFVKTLKQYKSYTM